MKYYFIVFALFMLSPTNPIYCQDTVVVVAQRIVRHGSEEYNNRIKKDRAVFVQKYVDSINNYKVSKKDSFPAFFTTIDFDEKYGRQFNLTVNGKVSIRKLIIDQLTNENLMWRVKRSNDLRLKLKHEDKPPGIANYYDPIPFQQHSTYELVVMRLDEIENNRCLGIKEN